MGGPTFSWTTLPGQPGTRLNALDVLLCVCRELLADISFPYAKCQAYSCNDSPWSMYVKYKMTGRVSAHTQPAAPSPYGHHH
jgi:hypothetical protein